MKLLLTLSCLFPLSALAVDTIPYDGAGAEAITLVQKALPTFKGQLRTLQIEGVPAFEHKYIKKKKSKHQLETVASELNYADEKAKKIIDDLSRSLADQKEESEEEKTMTAAEKNEAYQARGKEVQTSFAEVGTFGVRLRERWSGGSVICKTVAVNPASIRYKCALGFGYSDGGSHSFVDLEFDLLPGGKIVPRKISQTGSG